MRTKFTLSDPDTATVMWVLMYDLNNPIPFTTEYGTPHVWNWDFIRGELTQDGVAFTDCAIAIEVA
jgi:hypothetical protein